MKVTDDLESEYRKCESQISVIRSAIMSDAIPNPHQPPIVLDQPTCSSVEKKGNRYIYIYIYIS